MPNDWIVALAAAPWVYLVLYAIAALDGFFPPVPSESVVIALAALSVSAGIPNLLLVLLAATAGAFTGDQLAYAIGGRLEVRRLWILRSARGRRTVDWAEGAMAKRGPSFILAARFIPIGRVAVNMTAGATGYPRRRFVALTAVAAVSWSLYSVAIGLTAGAWFRDRPLVAVAIGVVGGTLGGLVLDRGLARRHARRPAGQQRVGEEVPAGAGGAPVDVDLVR